MIALGDDGTLDTVVYCTDCGQEWRFNHDFGDAATCTECATHEEVLAVRAYEEFVMDCLAEVTTEHECGEVA